MKKLKKYFVFSFAILLAFGFSSSALASVSVYFSLNTNGDFTLSNITGSGGTFFIFGNDGTMLSSDTTDKIANLSTWGYSSGNYIFDGAGDSGLYDCYTASNYSGCEAVLTNIIEDSTWDMIIPTPHTVILSAPTVSTQAVSDIDITTATGEGTVISDGGATITERGVVWALTSNPTTANSKATKAGTTGSYTADITGLTGGVLYHVRAYAINSEGTSYGSDVSFTTLTTPPPPSGSGHGISILGGTAPSVGTPVDGANFTSQTATAVQAMLSNKGIGTPLSTVLGIILALIIATWIVAIVRLTSEYRKDEKGSKENKLS